MAGGAGSPPNIPAQDEDGVGRPRVRSGYERRRPGTGRSEQAAAVLYVGATGVIGILLVAWALFR